MTYLAQHLGANLIAAGNWSFFLSWILAGFCAYLLAWEITRRRAPALVAGLFVMTHSFTLSCTLQNWSRFNLYGIALFLWTLARARRWGRWRDYIWSGVALAWTAACHYYFLIYSLLIWTAVFLADYSPFGCRFTRLPRRARWGRVCLSLSVAAGAVALWIIFGHPGELVFGTTRIGLETPYNALLVMWLGLFGWLVSEWKVESYRRAEVLVRPAIYWQK